MSAIAESVDIGQMITRTPGIKGGAPHVTGTGVTVRTIVRWYHAGLLPEEIALRIGHLSIGQVHAALAYYYASQESMDREIAEEDAEADRIEREHLAQHPPRQNRA